MGEYKNFYSLTRFLKKEVPAVFYVRRVKCPKGTLGDCVYYRKKYYIRIEKSLPEISAMDVLVHEVAHSISWHGRDKDDHGPEWGRAFARIYRKYLEWVDLADYYG